jgi:hypothetical protein
MPIDRRPWGNGRRPSRRSWAQRIPTDRSIRFTKNLIRTSLTRISAFHGPVSEGRGMLATFMLVWNTAARAIASNRSVSRPRSAASWSMSLTSNGRWYIAKLLGNTFSRSLASITQDFGIEKMRSGPAKRRPRGPSGQTGRGAGSRQAGGVAVAACLDRAPKTEK